MSKAGCGVRPTGRSDRMTAIPLLKLPAGLHVSDPVVPGAVMLEILSKVTALQSPPSDPSAEAGSQSSGGASI